MLKSSILRLPKGVFTLDILEAIMEDARNHFHHSKDEFSRIYPGQDPDKFDFEISLKKIKE